MIFFATHRKFISALVGIAIIILNRRYGVELTGMEPLLIDLVIGLATVFAVERIPNAPARAEPEEGDVL